MNCSNCQHENEADAAFCEACGTKLELGCAHCGRALKPAANFCPGCGNAVTPIKESAEPAPRAVVDYTPKHLAEKILQSRSALEGERKQVTVLFADIKGSMHLAGQLDAEDWHSLLDSFFAILNDGVHRFEGTVNQYTGDGIMALFGAPIAHEDHAQRACYAALQLRDELRRFSVALRVERGIDFSTRIGINSGEVVVGKIGDDLRMDYTAQGQTVGIAQRLESIAEPGHVYISEHTAHLVEGYFRLIDLGVAELAGVENPRRIFDLDGTTAASTRFDVSRVRGLTRFIGRHDEMDVLTAALARARSGFGQVVGVVGEPGQGKSRLCFEFVEHCRGQGIPVYDTSCPAHGKAIPFIPILELFRKFFAITAQDPPAQARQKIAGALILLDPAMHAVLPVLFEFLGVADPHNPVEPIGAEARQRQLFELVHKVTQARNERGLVSVIFIDDLHWIDSWSDAFVAHMVEATQASHTLLLVNFRPEYQASWTVKPHYQQLPLVPLGEDAVREMAASLLGDDDSILSLIEKIMQWTDGNPLFAEEILNTLIETDQLIGARGAYRLNHDVETLDLPPTILTIIAARIDRLDETCKHILHSASVLGKKFTRPLIERIVKISMPELIAAIEQLKTLDLIYEVSLYPTIEFSFKHSLVHEVAYNTQLKKHRAARHASAAAAIEMLEAENLDEFASTLAYHWDAANEPARAVEWHQRAGEYTLMNDPAASLRHWQRVRDLINKLPSDPETLALGALSCTRILDIGWQLGFPEEEAARCFDDGKALAERSGDVALLARLTGAFAALRGINLGYAAEYVTLAAEAVRLAQRTDDTILEWAMQFRLAHGYFLSGQHAAACDLCAKELQQIPETGAGPRPVLLLIRGLALSMTKTDPGLACRCLQESQDLAAARSLAELEIAIHGNWAQLLCLQGDHVAARKHASAAIQLSENLGTGLGHSWAAFALARVSQAEGAFEQAIGSFHDALRIAKESRTSGFIIGSALAGLADSLLTCGDHKQAQQYAEDAVEFARSHALAWDLNPWLALTRTRTHNLDPTGARKAIEETQQMIDNTGAIIFQPFLHECRAAFAESFDCEWSPADELKEAHRLFMK